MCVDGCVDGCVVDVPVVVAVVVVVASLLIYPEKRTHILIVEMGGTPGL